MPRRTAQSHLTPQRKAAFLVELARCGVATRAAKAASPEATGSCIQTFRDARKIDGEFARAWDAAIEQHAGDLLAELYRRAKDGDQIPIQNAKGELIGWRSVRSDKLLLEAVREHVPMFTPNTVSEVTAKVRTEPMGLDSLSAESQDELARILEREQARRRELPSANAAEPYSALPIEERTR